MTDTIKQDNRSELSQAQDEKIKLLVKLLNEDSEKIPACTDTHNTDSATASTFVYVTGNNNIVSTQKSTIVIKKQPYMKHFILSACAILFF